MLLAWIVLSCLTNSSWRRCSEGGQVGVADVLDHLLHRGGLGVDAGTLINAGQERGLVIGGTAQGQATVAQRDEAGEVLVFGAESVDNPRAEAGFGDAQRAGVHEHRGDIVSGNVRPHGADHGEVVGEGTDFGEHLADFQAGTAHRGELKRRAHGHATAGKGFTIEGAEGGFGIPGVNVGGRTLGKDVDDALGFTGEVRRVR